MAIFTYRALNDQAAAIEGMIAADTARAARDMLRARGLLVESVAASDTDWAWPAVEKLIRAL